VWIGDFEAWRRVAAFTLRKLRMGVDSGILHCALSDGSASALAGGSLLRRKGTLPRGPTATARIPQSRTAAMPSGVLVWNGADSPVSLPGCIPGTDNNKQGSAKQQTGLQRRPSLVACG